jgi:hypothetical protein
LKKKNGGVFSQVGRGSGHLIDGGSYVSYVWDSSSSSSADHDTPDDTGTDDADAGSSLEFSLVIEKVSPHLAGCGFSSQGNYNVTDETATFTLTAGTALR